MKHVLFLLFLNLQFSFFSQLAEKKESSKVFVEAKAFMYKIAFFHHNGNPYNGVLYEKIIGQSRVSFNTDIVFRNNRVNTGIGNSWVVFGSGNYLDYQKLPRLFYMRDVYAKFGYNLAHHFKKKENYYGPYLQVEFLARDVVYARVCYNLGFEIYEKNRVRFSISYGLFHFDKITRNKYQAKGYTVFSSYQVGFNVGYSFPIRDPWVPH